MGDYSKLVATIVGFALSFAVGKFALPTEWASPETVTSVSGAITAILVYAFPANKPA